MKIIQYTHSETILCFDIQCILYTYKYITFTDNKYENIIYYSLHFTSYCQYFWSMLNSNDNNNNSRYCEYEYKFMYGNTTIYIYYNL